MTDIDYCEIPPDHEWQGESSFSGSWEGLSQDLVDDCASALDKTWFPGESQTVSSNANQSTEKTFLQHAERWGRETAHLSSPSQIMMHPSYQAALGMAQDNKDAIVRLMLIDMRDKRRLWFLALSFLTQENPVEASQAGKLDAMILAWVQWGKRKGII